MADDSNHPEVYVTSSDDEKPTPKGRNARPISIIAQNFATDLDSMFGLGPAAAGIDALSQTVEQKKKHVSSTQSELELLEAKLRETEQRLAKVSRQSSPARAGAGSSEQTSAAATAAGTSARNSSGGAALYPPSHQAPQPPSGQPAAGSGREDYVMVDKGSER